MESLREWWLDREKEVEVGRGGSVLVLKLALCEMGLGRVARNSVDRLSTIMCRGEGAGGGELWL